MSDMVKYKRSAEIVKTPRGATATYAPPARTKAVIRGVTRKDVLDELGRRQRAGTIGATGSLELITSGRAAGTYMLPIEIIDAPHVPRWRKPLKVTAWIAASTGTLVGLGWWAAASMGALPLAALLIAILVGFIYAVRRGHGSGSSGGARGVTVTTTTTVNFH